MDKNSAYWLSEKVKTQEYLSQLVHGELAGIKSTKSDNDTLQMQDIDKEIEKCKMYIKYCEDEYQKALDEEQGIKKNKYKSILKFPREFGY